MNLWRRKTARAYIFDTEKKLFLLVKSSLPPYGLQLPGGGIDKGESPEDAVKREIREELNILPQNIISIEYIGPRKSTVLFIPHLDELFLVRIKDVEFKLSWEIKEIIWKDAEEIRSERNSEILDMALHDRKL